VGIPQAQEEVITEILIMSAPVFAETTVPSASRFGHSWHPISCGQDQYLIADRDDRGPLFLKMNHSEMSLRGVRSEVAIW
jgi:hypothetical protein